MAMASRRCKELCKMSAVDLAAFFGSFDVVMTDCDGVLWNGNQEIPGAANCVRTLRDKLGKKIYYCTNNSTKSRQDYVEKCKHLGFEGELDDMIGTSFLAAEYLKAQKFDGTVYVVGSTGITKELDNLGIQHTGLEEPNGIYQADHLPDGSSASAPMSGYADIISDMSKWGRDKEGKAVDGVVVGMDLQISYRKLAKAAIILKRPETVFVATNTDEQFPHGSGVILPGTGAVVSAVTNAAGRQPVVLGKPHPAMFEAVKRMRPQTTPQRTLMIGDRANTDILLGTRCGLQTLLVGTGVHSLEDTRRWESSDKQEDHGLVADYYVKCIADLVELSSQTQ